MVQKAELTELQHLERLVGQPIKREIDIDGTVHEVVLRRIKVGRIPQIVHAAGPLMATLTNRELKIDALEMLTFHSNDALNLLAQLLEKDRSFVDELDIDDAAMLLMDVIELNVDFFVRRVLPVFSVALQRLLENSKIKAALEESATG